MKERNEGSEIPGVRTLWEITKPDNLNHAEVYFRVLNETLVIPKLKRFEKPFQRLKKSGNGARTIVPAAEPLRTTQWFLSNWIRDNLPQGEDYCYSGRKVNAALNVHRESSFALVCDLKNAFDQVTEQKIRHWFPLYDRRLTGETLGLIVDLLTYEGRTPQGCRSTAFVYNAVVSEMDQHLGIVAGSFGDLRWTRYSDNICFSSKTEFDTIELEEQVKRIVGGFGFELSWTKHQRGSIDYLGATIRDGKINIADEKVGELEDRIYDWIDSGDPQAHYREALGILTWARGLSGPNVHPDLLRTLDIFFRKIGRPNTAEKNMGTAYGKLL